MATNINTILGWFKTGKKPTQEQFWASWQSFWHKDEAIPQSKIKNLVNTLETKIDKSQFEAHNVNPNAHPNLFTAGENIKIINNMISSSGVLFGDSDNLAKGDREFDVATNNFTYKNVNEFNIIGSSSPSFIAYTRMYTGMFYSTEIAGKWVFMELYNGIPQSPVTGSKLLIRLTIDSLEEEILFYASLLPEGGNTPYYWMPAREGVNSVLCNGYYGDTNTSIVKMTVPTGKPNPNSIAYFDGNQLKKGIFNLQSATDGGNATSNSIIIDDSYNDQISELSITGLNVKSRSNNQRYTDIGAGGINLSIDNKYASLTPYQLSLSQVDSANGSGRAFVITDADISYYNGIYGNGGNRLNFKRENGNPNIYPTFNFPEKPHGTYTLATTDDTLNDNNLVHKTGNEVIGTGKIFKTNLEVRQDDLNIQEYTTYSWNGPHISRPATEGMLSDYWVNLSNTNGNYGRLTANNLEFGNSNGNVSITPSLIGTSINLSLPESSGRLALKSDILPQSIPTLQEIVTANPIISNGQNIINELGVGRTVIGPGIIAIYQNEESEKSSHYGSSHLQFLDGTGNHATIWASGGNGTYFIPNKANGNYTLATTQDIKIGILAPSSSTDVGEPGEIRVTTGYIYWCTAPNTWFRANATTF